MGILGRCLAPTATFRVRRCHTCQAIWRRLLASQFTVRSDISCTPDDRVHRGAEIDFYGLPGAEGTRQSPCIEKRAALSFSPMPLVFFRELSFRSRAGYDASLERIQLHAGKR